MAGATSSPRSVAEHQDAVAALLPRTPVDRIPLSGCLGLVLAEPIVAPIPLPPFDNSAMDGYAVRAADLTTEGPTTLPVAEDVPAGRTDAPLLRPGTTHRIMTGAPMPDGADAVVPVEVTDAGRHQVRIDAGARPGAHIRLAGGDLHAGEQVLPAGTVLGPAQLGVAAAVGLDRLPVHRPLRVLVLSTGSELVAPGSALQHGQIYESNGALLAAAVTEAGGQAELLHFVPDDVAELDRRLGPALEGRDLLVTSGGVSAGAFEVVKDAMDGRGVDFVRVAMQPGAPQGVGRYRGVPVASLPGNPVSSSVSFEIFVRPALRAAMALPPWRETVTARITERVVAPAGKRQFRRGTLQVEAGTVCPVGGPGSHLLAALARSNCLIDIPDAVTEIGDGELVRVLRTSPGSPSGCFG